MDPLCGGTRATYLLMRGHLLEAVRYNPAAPVILAATVTVAARAAVGWLTGRRVTVRVPRRIWVTLTFAVVVALEINQQANAALLIDRWNG